MPTPTPPPLPGTYHQEDSILSLNTTASDMSDYPPTNPGDTSVSNLPRWSIQLSKLTELADLIHRPTGLGHDVEYGSESLCVIVCVSAVSGPDLVRSKDDKARGREGTLWRASWEVVAPNKQGTREIGFQVMLWGQCAERADTVRRGDIVLIQSGFFTTSYAACSPQTRSSKGRLQLSRNHNSLCRHLTCPRSPSSTARYLVTKETHTSGPARACDRRWRGRSCRRIIHSDLISG